ncbi:hypothetical protein [Microbacterium sp. TNHR37B]|uniref:hypothetical protein n=1 Tax=Microbacterium sp. TNHR37B TaxID=1775956 RepID=UPI0007B1E734|nr:hypothetical protein [Microbacterium sp. TNHR37B]KZE91175.1 hypothetical protein AVP41_00710 [Microbacterium sp. TNHR37B]
MAAGFLDTNGVWMFGEDDQRDTFSDLLNIGQDSVSDAIGADRARLTTLETLTTLGAGATGFIASAPGWNLSNIQGRKRGGLAFIGFLATRTGAAITVPSGDGNIVNQLMGGLGAGWQRASGINVSLVHDGFTGAIMSGYINASNELWLGTVAPGTSTFPTGAQVGFNAVYPLA